jgi:AraC family transcriptional regulator
MVVTTNILMIKNMVCHRCVISVEDILKKESIPFHKVEVGEIHLCDNLQDIQRQLIKDQLEKIGLELIDNRMGGMIEKMKQLIIKKARNEVEDKEKKVKLSSYLVSNLHHEYTYLSSLFSNTEGRTIENFFIHHRIEKAKELFVYGQLNLSQIAFELEYSSVAHLSSQFKKITGLTPSHFKEIGMSKRKTLDQI